MSIMRIFVMAAGTLLLALRIALRIIWTMVVVITSLAITVFTSSPEQRLRKLDGQIEWGQEIVMLPCPHCHAQNEEDARYCYACGGSLSATRDTFPLNLRLPDSLIYVGIALGSFAFVLFLLFLVFG